MAPLQRGLALAYLYVNDCDGRLRPSPFREGIGFTSATTARGLVNFSGEMIVLRRWINPSGENLQIFATSLFKGGMDCPSILLYCIVLQQ